MSRNLKIEGFVLRKIKLLRNDYIVTIFTKSKGKIRCVAKGLQKINSKRIASLQTGSLIKAELYEHRESLYLREISLRSLFRTIRVDSIKVNKFYLYIFLLDRLLPENEVEISLFDLTIDYCTRLSKGTVTEDYFLEVINKLLMYLGYLSDHRSITGSNKYIESIIGEQIPYGII